jgi:hypothetical protein
MLSLNWPMQLDDDVQYFIRAIYFSADPLNTLNQDSFPGTLVRIRDCYGNPLSDGLVLSMGVWCNQEENINGFGFPVEPEVECPPGGTLLFDFQIYSQGNFASFLDVIGPSSLFFQSSVMGAAGNGRTITLVDPGAPNVPLSVSVGGVDNVDVTVTLATNGASVITSTVADVQAIITATPAAFASMFATVTGPLTTLATALAATPLVGGSDAVGTVPIIGSFMGVKRFKECL